MARALLLRPDWLFLDEATGALDPAMEAKLYKLLRERLPDAAIVSIAHNPSVVAFHDRRVMIDPAARRLRVAPMRSRGERRWARRRKALLLNKPANVHGF